LKEQYDEDVKEDVKRRRSMPRKHEDKVQPAICDIFPVSSQRTLSKLDKLIVDFVVKGIHAYSIVEEEGFRNLVHGKLIP
jgi:hypothetical protein